MRTAAPPRAAASRTRLRENYRCSTPSARTRFLSALERDLRVPDPFDTFEDFERHHHLDLPGLDRIGLLVEEHRARRALTMLAAWDRRRSWHVDRLRRILDELTIRPGSART